MKVFISWSGSLSREVAEILASFLQHVVRGVDTFVSVRNIAAGDLWEERLDAELEEAQHAVVCVTRTNQHSAWLNYEVGALARTLGHARVIPYTIDLLPGEQLEGPLRRFQAVSGDEAGTWSLVRTLSCLSPKPDGEAFVRDDFDVWWPRLHEKLQATSGACSVVPEQPSTHDLLLSLRRDVQEIMAELVLRRDEERRPSAAVAKSTLAVTAGSSGRVSQIDPMTSLLSRAGLMQTESAELCTSVVAFMDLDGLKPINDQYGHALGDEVIKHAANMLKQQLSAAHAIARVGGDEFIAIFRDCTQDAVVAEIEHAIQAFPMLLESARLPQLVFSAGVSSDEPEPLVDKLREADRAMYEAKKAGGGCVFSAVARVSISSRAPTLVTKGVVGR